MFDGRQGSFSRTLRIIAFLLIISFGWNTVSYAAPDGLQALQNISAQSDENLKNILQTLIPESLGRVSDYFLPKECQGKSFNCPTVIYLQDAHANLDAQENLQKIGRIVSNRFNIHTILAEGASGEADLSRIRSYPNQKVKELTTKFWLEQVILTGLEAEAILNPKTYRLIGAEDQALYDLNRNQFLDVLEAQKEILPTIDGLLKQNRESKENRYNKRLLEFENRVALYEQHGELISLVSYLTNLGRDEGIKRADLLQVEKLISLIVLEHTLANSKQDEKLDEKKAFEKLSLEIGAVGLFQEIDVFKDRIREKLFTNSEERKLHREDDHLTHTQALIVLQATPDDFAYYQEHKSEIKKFLKGSLDFKKLELAEQFYVTSRKRDDAFLERVKNHLSSSIILVTGGFHAEDLTAQFRKENIPFVLISPQVSPETNFDRYYENMKGETLNLERFQPKFETFLKSSAISNPLQLFNNDFDPEAYFKITESQVRSELRTEKWHLVPTNLEDRGDHIDLLPADLPIIFGFIKTGVIDPMLDVFKQSQITSISIASFLGAGESLYHAHFTDSLDHVSFYRFVNGTFIKPLGTVTPGASVDLEGLFRLALIPVPVIGASMFSITRHFPKSSEGGDVVVFSRNSFRSELRSQNEYRGVRGHQTPSPNKNPKPEILNRRLGDPLILQPDGTYAPINQIPENETEKAKDGDESEKRSELRESGEEVILKGSKNLVRRVFRGIVLVFQPDDFYSAAYSLRKHFDTDEDVKIKVQEEKERFALKIDRYINETPSDEKEWLKILNDLKEYVLQGVEKQELRADYLFKEKTYEWTHTFGYFFKNFFWSTTHPTLSKRLSTFALEFSQPVKLSPAEIEKQIKLYQASLKIIDINLQSKAQELKQKGRFRDSKAISSTRIIFMDFAGRIIKAAEKVKVDGVETKISPIEMEKISALDMLREVLNPETEDRYQAAGTVLPFLANAVQGMILKLNTREKKPEEETIRAQNQEILSDFYRLLSLLSYGDTFELKNMPPNLLRKKIKKNQELFTDSINFVKGKIIDQAPTEHVPQGFTAQELLSHLESDVGNRIQKQHQFSDLALQYAIVDLFNLIDAKLAETDLSQESKNALKHTREIIETGLEEVSTKINRRFVANKRFRHEKGKDLIVVVKTSKKQPYLQGGMSIPVVFDLKEAYPNLGAIALESGSPTEHWAIVASNHNFLTLTSLKSKKGRFSAIESGETAYADGEDGSLVVNPSSEVAQEKEEKILIEKTYLRFAKRHVKRPASALKNGAPAVSISVDGTADSITHAEALGRFTKSIRLLRTETGITLNFFKHTSLADNIQDYQERLVGLFFEISKYLRDVFAIRTFDFQPDKENIIGLSPNEIKYGFGFYKTEKGEQVLRAQMRATIIAALERAKEPNQTGKHNNKTPEFRIYLPMIHNEEEIKWAREVWDQEKSVFSEELKHYKIQIPFGVMIETQEVLGYLPEVVNRKYVDFISIGTNDLLREFFKIDRAADDPALTEVRAMFLQKIEEIVAQASKQGIEVSICGEMAGWRRFMLFLIYLGGKYPSTKISVAVTAAVLPTLKMLIRHTHFEEVADIFDDLENWIPDEKREREEKQDKQRKGEVLPADGLSDLLRKKVHEIESRTHSLSEFQQLYKEEKSRRRSELRSGEIENTAKLITDSFVGSFEGVTRVKTVELAEEVIAPKGPEGSVASQVSVIHPHAVVAARSMNYKRISKIGDQPVLEAIANERLLEIAQSYFDLMKTFSAVVKVGELGYRKASFYIGQVLGLGRSDSNSTLKLDAASVIVESPAGLGNADMEGSASIGVYSLPDKIREIPYRVYWDKFVVAPKFSKWIDTRFKNLRTPHRQIQYLAKKSRKKMKNMKAVILYRYRSEEQIKKLLETGLSLGKDFPDFGSKNVKERKKSFEDLFDYVDNTIQGEGHIVIGNVLFLKDGTIIPERLLQSGEYDFIFGSVPSLNVSISAAWSKVLGTRLFARLRIPKNDLELPSMKERLRSFNIWIEKGDKSAQQPGIESHIKFHDDIWTENDFILTDDFSVVTSALESLPFFTMRDDSRNHKTKPVPGAYLDQDGNVVIHVIHMDGRSKAVRIWKITYETQISELKARLQKFAPHFPEIDPKDPQKAPYESNELAYQLGILYEKFGAFKEAKKALKFALDVSKIPGDEKKAKFYQRMLEVYDGMSDLMEVPIVKENIRSGILDVVIINFQKAFGFFERSQDPEYEPLRKAIARLLVIINEQAGDQIMRLSEQETDPHKKENYYRGALVRYKRALRFDPLDINLLQKVRKTELQSPIDRFDERYQMDPDFYPGEQDQMIADLYLRYRLFGEQGAVLTNLIFETEFKYLPPATRIAYFLALRLLRATLENATEDELAQIPVINRELAKKIIAFRESYRDRGPFRDMGHLFLNSIGLDPIHFSTLLNYVAQTQVSHNQFKGYNQSRGITSAARTPDETLDTRIKWLEQMIKLYGENDAPSDQYMQNIFVELAEAYHWKALLLSNYNRSSDSHVFFRKSIETFHLVSKKFPFAAAYFAYARMIEVSVAASLHKDAAPQEIEDWITEAKTKLEDLEDPEKAVKILQRGSKENASSASDYFSESLLPHLRTLIQQAEKLLSKRSELRTADDDANLKAWQTALSRGRQALSQVNRGKTNYGDAAAEFNRLFTEDWFSELESLSLSRLAPPVYVKSIDIEDVFKGLEELDKIETLTKESLSIIERLLSGLSEGEYAGVYKDLLRIQKRFQQFSSDMGSSDQRETVYSWLLDLEEGLLKANELLSNNSKKFNEKLGEINKILSGIFSKKDVSEIKKLVLERKHSDEAMLSQLSAARADRILFSFKKVTSLMRTLMHAQSADDLRRLAIGSFSFDNALENRAKLEEQLKIASESSTFLTTFLSNLEHNQLTEFFNDLDDQRKQLEEILSLMGTADERQLFYSWLAQADSLSDIIPRILEQSRLNTSAKKLDVMLAILSPRSKDSIFFANKITPVFRRLTKDFKSLPESSDISIQRTRIEVFYQTMLKVAAAADKFLTDGQFEDSPSTNNKKRDVLKRINEIRDSLSTQVYTRWFQYYLGKAKEKLTKADQLLEQVEPVAAEALLKEARLILEEAYKNLDQVFSHQIEQSGSTMLQIEFRDLALAEGHRLKLLKSMLDSSRTTHELIETQTDLIIQAVERSFAQSGALPIETQLTIKIDYFLIFGLNRLAVSHMHENIRRSSMLGMTQMKDDTTIRGLRFADKTQKTILRYMLLHHLTENQELEELFSQTIKSEAPDQIEALVEKIYTDDKYRDVTIRVGQVHEWLVEKLEAWQVDANSEHTMHALSDYETLRDPNNPIEIDHEIGIDKRIQIEDAILDKNPNQSFEELPVDQNALRKYLDFSIAKYLIPDELIHDPDHLFKYQDGPNKGKIMAPLIIALILWEEIYKKVHNDLEDVVWHPRLGTAIGGSKAGEALQYIIDRGLLFVPPTNPAFSGTGVSSRDMLKDGLEFAQLLYDPKSEMAKEIQNILGPEQILFEQLCIRLGLFTQEEIDFIKLERQESEKNEVSSAISSLEPPAPEPSLGEPEEESSVLPPRLTEMLDQLDKKIGTEIDDQNAIEGEEKIAEADSGTAALTTPQEPAKPKSGAWAIYALPENFVRLLLDPTLSYWDRVRQIAQARGIEKITTSELFNYIREPYSYVQSVLSGSKKNIKFEEVSSLVKKLAQALNVTTDLILGINLNPPAEIDADPYPLNEVNKFLPAYARPKRSAATAADTSARSSIASQPTHVEAAKIEPVTVSRIPDPEPEPEMVAEIPKPEPEPEPEKPVVFGSQEYKEQLIDRLRAQIMLTLPYKVRKILYLKHSQARLILELVGLELAPKMIQVKSRRGDLVWKAVPNAFVMKDAWENQTPQMDAYLKLSKTPEARELMRALFVLLTDYSVLKEAFGINYERVDLLIDLRHRMGRLQEEQQIELAKLEKARRDFDELQASIKRIDELVHDIKIPQPEEEIPAEPRSELRSESNIPVTQIIGDLAGNDTEKLQAIAGEIKLAIEHKLRLGVTPLFDKYQVLILKKKLTAEHVLKLGSYGLDSDNPEKELSRYQKKLLDEIWRIELDEKLDKKLPISKSILSIFDYVDLMPMPFKKYFAEFVAQYQNGAQPLLGTVNWHQYNDAVVEFKSRLEAQNFDGAIEFMNSQKSPGILFTAYMVSALTAEQGYMKVLTNLRVLVMSGLSMLLYETGLQLLFSEHFDDILMRDFEAMLRSGPEQSIVERKTIIAELKKKLNVQELKGHVILDAEDEKRVRLQDLDQLEYAAGEKNDKRSLQLVQLLKNSESNPESMSELRLVARVAAGRPKFKRREALLVSNRSELRSEQSVKELQKELSGVSILNAGGTIDMIGEFARKTADAVRILSTHLKHVAFYKNVFDKNPDSTNIGPKEWEQIIDHINDELLRKTKLAKEVNVSQKEMGGIILTHGTDTLAETGLILSLEFDGSLPTRVVLTGSSTVNEKEKILNLKAAEEVAKRTDIPNLVYVVIDSQIYLGSLISKIRTDASSTGNFFASYGKAVGAVDSNGNINFDMDFLQTVNGKLANLEKQPKFHKNEEFGYVEHLLIDETTPALVLFQASNRIERYAEQAGVRAGLIIQGDFSKSPEIEYIRAIIQNLKRKKILVISNVSASGTINIPYHMTSSKARTKLSWLLRAGVSFESLEKELKRDFIGETGGLWGRTDIPAWAQEKFPNNNFRKGREIVLAFPGIIPEVFIDASDRLLISGGSNKKELLVRGFGDGNVPLENRSIQDILLTYLTSRHPGLADASFHELPFIGPEKDMDLERRLRQKISELSDNGRVQILNSYQIQNPRLLTKQLISEATKGQKFSNDVQKISRVQEFVQGVFPAWPRFSEVKTVDELIRVLDERFAGLTILEQEQFFSKFPKYLARRIIKDALTSANPILKVISEIEDKNVQVKILTNAVFGRTNLQMYELGNMLMAVGADGQKSKGWKSALISNRSELRLKQTASSTALAWPRSDAKSELRHEANQVNIPSNVKGNIIISFEELRNRSELREAILANVNANPGSKIEFSVVAPEFDNTLVAEKAVEDLFAGVDIFGKQSGRKSRLQLYTRDRLGVGRELSAEQAYNILIDRLKHEFNAKGITTRIVAIGQRQLFVKLTRRDIPKLLSRAEAIQAAQLLIAYDDSFDFRSLGDVIDPSAEFISSLMSTLLNRAALGKAA